MKWKVSLTRPSYEYAEVEIEAATKDAAEAAAALAATGSGPGYSSLSWEGGDDVGEPTVVGVEPADEEAYRAEELLDAQAAHAADDPHCTCPDCILSHVSRLEHEP